MYIALYQNKKLKSQFCWVEVLLQTKLNMNKVTLRMKYVKIIKKIGLSRAEHSVSQPVFIFSSVPDRPTLYILSQDTTIVCR